MSDPYPQYQLRSERGAGFGYAPVDDVGLVPLTHLPSTLVTTTGLAAHVAAADPHPGYQRESERGAANGYASLDAGGHIPGTQLPGSFFGWQSVASGFVDTSEDAVYEVPASKIANIVFISVKNTSSTTNTVDVLIQRSGELAVSIGTCQLAEQEFAWYVELGLDSLPLSTGDQVRMVTDLTPGVVQYLLLGAVKDA